MSLDVLLIIDADIRKSENIYMGYKQQLFTDRYPAINKEMTRKWIP